MPCQLNRDALAGLRPSLLFSPVIDYQVHAVFSREEPETTASWRIYDCSETCAGVGGNNSTLGEITGVVILQKGNRIRESSYLSILLSALLWETEGCWQRDTKHDCVRFINLERGTFVKWRNIRRSGRVFFSIHNQGRTAVRTSM